MGIGLVHGFGVMIRVLAKGKEKPEGLTTVMMNSLGAGGYSLVLAFGRWCVGIYWGEGWKRDS